jgi:hypothetical protein
MISLIIFLGCMLFTVQEAYAYLDPGTGSMILQGIIAGVATVAVLGRLYWQRLLKFFGVRKDESLKNVQQEESAEYTDKQTDAKPLETETK